MTGFIAGSLKGQMARNAANSAQGGSPIRTMDDSPLELNPEIIDIQRGHIFYFKSKQILL